MAAFTYEYRVPGLQKAPAEVAGAVCMALENSEKGLTPTTLLEASRDEHAPLHDEFEWRDDVAAEQYRKDQARHLIQNLVIRRVEDTNPANDRAFVITPGYKGQYVALKTALTDTEYRAHLLHEAERDAMTFLGKYRRLQELAEIIKPMEKFLDKAQNA